MFAKSQNLAAIFSVVCFTLVLCIAAPAFARGGEIKALIIGNDSYQRSEMFPSLRGTSRRDAEAVEEALRSAGVAKKNIVTRYDLDFQSFFEAIHDFRQTISSEDSVIFYYSGHGFSIDDHAFLVPVDFRLGVTKRNAQLRSVSLDQVRIDLSKGRMRALIIDACRTDIPLLKQSVGMKPSLSLANLYDAKPAGTGELIVFATQGGKPAIADAPAEGLSFFTYYFVKRFQSTLPDLGTVARQAQIATAMASNYSQEPEVRDNLQGYLQFPSYANQMSLTSPFTPAIASPPAATADYDAMLPLVCPKNGEFLEGWQLGNGSPPQTYAGLIPSDKSFTALPTGDPLPVAVNPVLRGLIGAGPTRLPEQTLKEVDALFREIDSASKQTEPLRGPSGSIKLSRSYVFLSRTPRKRATYIDAMYASFAGSVSIGTKSTRVSLTDLSQPMQELVRRLDELAAANFDQACELAVQRLTGSTP